MAHVLLALLMQAHDDVRIIGALLRNEAVGTECTFVLDSAAQALARRHDESVLG